MCVCHMFNKVLTYLLTYLLTYSITKSTTAQFSSICLITHTWILLLRFKIIMDTHIRAHLIIIGMFKPTMK